MARLSRYRTHVQLLAVNFVGIEVKHYHRGVYHIQTLTRSGLVILVPVKLTDRPLTKRHADKQSPLESRMHLCAQLHLVLYFILLQGHHMLVML